MGQDPAVIRAEIEHTREHMGEAVDALGYKADVPARTKEAVAERVDSLRSKITGMGSQVSQAADPGDVKDSVRRAAGVAQENPVGLAVGAAAAGFLAGMLLPSTRIEDERVGPVAEQVKEQARQTGQEALEHGRQVAQETASKVQEAAAEVGEAAKESAQTHAQELSESARESAAETQQQPAGGR